jgi:hypothetical protein
MEEMRLRREEKKAKAAQSVINDELDAVLKANENRCRHITDQEKEFLRASEAKHQHQRPSTSIRGQALPKVFGNTF